MTPGAIEATNGAGTNTLSFLNAGLNRPRGQSRPLLIGGFLLCLGLLAGRGLGWWLDQKPPPEPGAVAGQRTLRAGRRMAVGPWGTLELLRIEIERPEEFMSSRPPPVEPSRWFFAGFNANQLRQLFDAPDLTVTQRRTLLDTSHWDVQPNGIYVTPGSGTVLGLSSDARQRLYGILATNTENFFQQWAFKLPRDSVDEWLNASGLAPSTVQLIRRLLYPRGDAVCFSDISEVMAAIPTDDEKLHLVKLLSRHSTVLARLRLQEGEDIEPLVRYWGKEGGAKDIRPLLASLARIPGGASVDITHLLPPFARMRLYTYPYPSEDPAKQHGDCAWTAMNFFNPEPDNRFYDFAATRRTIDSDYFPVQGDPSFGDVVWFSDANGTPLHFAVYIADDILFTKNGVNFNEPWILAEMKDLQADYASAQPMRIEVFRRKRDGD